MLSSHLFFGFAPEGPKPNLNSFSDVFASELSWSSEDFSSADFSFSSADLSLSSGTLVLTPLCSENITVQLRSKLKLITEL